MGATGRFAAAGALIPRPASGSRSDIWVLPLAGDRTPRPFVQTPADETSPDFSPDGHWIAYVSDESGREEVYMRPYPGPGGKQQVSTNGGFHPAWRKSGGELFYLAPANQAAYTMMSVEISTASAALNIGTPKPLFSGRFSRVALARSYDVTPDGQRFVTTRPSADRSPDPPVTQLHVVLNFLDDLKARVAAR